MKELVKELEERVAREPSAVVAIDAEGPHTLEAMMQAGDALAGTLEKVVGPEPTVLFQADNTWRTVAAAIADTGFQGYFAHEFIPVRDPLTSLREAVKLCTV